MGGRSLYIRDVLLTQPRAKRQGAAQQNRRWTNDVLMLAQRRRRWANIKPALVQRLVKWKTNRSIISFHFIDNHYVLYHQQTKGKFSRNYAKYQNAIVCCID